VKTAEATAEATLCARSASPFLDGSPLAALMRRECVVDYLLGLPAVIKAGRDSAAFQDLVDEKPAANGLLCEHGHEPTQKRLRSLDALEVRCGYRHILEWIVALRVSQAEAAGQAELHHQQACLAMEGHLPFGI